MARDLEESTFLCGIRDGAGQWRYLNDALRTHWSAADDAGDAVAGLAAGAPAGPTLVTDGNGRSALLAACDIPWDGTTATLVCGYDLPTAGARADTPPRDAVPILDALVHPVLVVDANARLAGCNEAARPYLNGAHHALAGLPLTDVLRLAGRADDGRALGTVVADAITAGQRRVTAIEEAGLVRRDGAEVPVKVTVSRLGGGRGALVILEDLSELHRRHSQLSLRARHDPLTGLINREEFTARLARLLERVGSQPWHHSLCFMDLDDFKQVNDSAGHAAGDELLRQVTTALLGRVRGRDTLARIGGDEFAILLEHCPLAEAREVAEKLRQTVEDFVFEWEGQRFGVGASIGLVPIGGDQDDAGRVVAMADGACYQAKNGGRNRVCVIESDDDKDVPRMVEGLRRALAEDTLLLHRQPLVALHGEAATVAHEVLLRLPAGGGIATPHELVPATRHRLNVEMDRWVLRRLAALPDSADRRPVLVNVAAASIQDKGFLRHLKDHEGGGPRLCFDVREDALLEAGEAATRFCDVVRRRGWDVALALRFEGPSVLYLLETLRPDFLAMDLRPVQGGGRLRRRLAEQLLELARLAGATTIATHLEDADLLATARGMDFDWGQGYLLGSPEPLTPEAPPGQ